MPKSAIFTTTLACNCLMPCGLAGSDLDTVCTIMSGELSHPLPIVLLQSCNFALRQAQQIALTLSTKLIVMRGLASTACQDRHGMRVYECTAIACSHTASLHACLCRALHIATDSVLTVHLDLRSLVQAKSSTAHSCAALFLHDVKL